MVQKALIIQLEKDHLFETYKKHAFGKGFLMVSSSPLTRSSYHASDDFQKLKNNRDKLELA